MEWVTISRPRSFRFSPTQSPNTVWLPTSFKTAEHQTVPAAEGGPASGLLIEHDDDDLRDLPLIDRKRRPAELIGKAKRAVTRDGQTAFPKNWSLAQYASRSSVSERAKLRHSRMRPPL